VTDQPEEYATDVHPDELLDEATDEHPHEPPDHGTVPAAEVTDPRIAAAVERLDGLADQPPVEHVEVYEEVHRVLQDSLADAARASDTRESPADGPGERPGGPRP
jgi:hypothetical protein